MYFKNVVIRPFLGIALCFLSGASLRAEEAVELANHIAIYDLQLENASDKSGITGLSGRMVYELSGSKCAGFTTRFRYVTRVDGPEGPARLTDIQTTTFETADGRDFRFQTKTYSDDKLDSEYEGNAHLDAKSIKVTMKKPEEAEYEHTKADFPTMETLEVIHNALSGKHFFRSTVFDGADGGNKLSETTTIIGQGQVTENTDDKALEPLNGQMAWPVSVAYFDDKENKDGLPTYRTAFLLYKNGVTRDLLMDYGAFSVRAKLVKLTYQNDDKDEKCAK